MQARTIHIVICALAVSAAAFAQTRADKPGTKDHPLVSRYQGSVIWDQVITNYDAYRLPLGLPLNDTIWDMRGKFKNQMDVEGKITATVYFAPAHSSTLLVYRNYESALKQAGFQTMFSCALSDCDGLINFWAGHWGAALNGGNSFNASQTRFIVAKLPKPTGVVYVTLGAVPLVQDVVMFLDIIETKTMATGLVMVKATEMANDISQTGHASIYGIYFDTGKAELKPESDATLTEISKLLAANSGLKLHVVGHTDNVGTLASNLTLSKQRSDAVVAALVSKYRVSADRLHAAGVGALAPVASNKTEDGRAKNRRVELVEQ